MDDGMSSDRERIHHDRTAPGAPAHQEQSGNGHRGHDADREIDRRQRPSKPALTERERRERWPVD